MNTVVRPIAERDFQLTGHVDIPADGQQVFGYCLGVGHNVKRLPRLHTAERAGHHVPGIVAAAALGENGAVNCRFHDFGHLACRQVVELDGLAGGQFYPVYLLTLHCLGQKFQLLQGQPAARHTQAQHVPGGVPLCIGTQAPGYALIGFPVELAPVKSADGLLKGLNFCPERAGPLVVHVVLNLSLI